MSPVKYKKEIPRKVCRDDKIKILKKLGIRAYSSDGLERIIKKEGFNLPGTDGEYYGFVIENMVYKCLNYADALAEELIELIQRGYIKKRRPNSRPRSSKLNH